MRFLRLWMAVILSVFAQVSCRLATPPATTSVSSAEEIRAEYGRVRRQLIRTYGDWMEASGREEFPDLLEAAWALAAEWAAAYLNSHPDANAEDLAQAIEQLNLLSECSEPDQECFRLDPNAVRLSAGERASYALSLNFSRAGTFSVLARDAEGRFRPAWDIRPLAKEHLTSRDQIGYWAYLAFPWGDGPLVGHVGSLAPGGSGRPRFYVAASAAALAGGTSPSQLSVWEWNGVAAQPLFIESYRGSFQAPGLEIEQETVRIHTKGEYESFFSCGTCPEPEVVWTIRITPVAVQDLGRKHVVPELELVDKLWSGVCHGASVDDVASPQVIEAIKPIIADAASEQESPSAYSLGMLGDWKVARENGHDVLYFSTDNLTCGPLRFELERRSAGPYLSHLDVIGPFVNETRPISR